jgi:hypothetical protein
MSEEIIYSDSEVSVTTTRVIILGTTYALRNITSVKMAMTPVKQGCAIALLILGIIMLLGAFGGLSSKDVGGAILGLLIAAGIVAGSVFWLRSLKPDYHVTIASSAGEAHALTSKDKNYISKIVESINDAIIRYQ